MPEARCVTATTVPPDGAVPDETTAGTEKLPVTNGHGTPEFLHRSHGEAIYAPKGITTGTGTVQAL